MLSCYLFSLEKNIGKSEQTLEQRKHSSPEWSLVDKGYDSFNYLILTAMKNSGFTKKIISSLLISTEFLQYKFWAYGDTSKQKRIFLERIF